MFQTTGSVTYFINPRLIDLSEKPKSPPAASSMVGSEIF